MPIDEVLGELPNSQITKTVAEEVTVKENLGIKSSIDKFAIEFIKSLINTVEDDNWLKSYGKTTDFLLKREENFNEINIFLSRKTWINDEVGMNFSTIPEIVNTYKLQIKQSSDILLSYKEHVDFVQSKKCLLSELYNNVYNRF
jgi:hypothetical protein